jgi:Putative phage holin Dp-1
LPLEIREGIFMTINSKLYDILKPVALIWLPALSTFYFAVATIWHIPNVQDVIGSIAALEALLGTGLHLSSGSYTPETDGQLIVDKSNPAKDVYSLELTTPFSELEGKSTITLSVAPGTTTPKSLSR